jgi:hypothetical protein
MARATRQRRRHGFLDNAIEVLLAALLTFAPFAFGAVRAWSQLVVTILAASICFCFCVNLIVNKRRRIIGSWVYLPIALYLAIPVFQLIPLSSHFVELISPNTTGLRTHLLGNLPNASEILKHTTLSFYPAATRHDFRIIVIAAAIFFVVLNTYRRPSQITRLLLVITAIGMLAAILAFAQDLTHATNIYWIGPPGRGGAANAGPFLTYSHYGQFMNLSIGAGLGLLLAMFQRNRNRSARQALNGKFPIVWFLAAFVVLGAVTVFLSGSRGAMAGLLIALAIASMTMSRTRGLVEGRAWIFVPLVFVACFAVLFLGPDAIFNRLATLQTANHYSDRWQILKDLTAEWKKFPLLGTGLGSHEVIYPMYDHSVHLETATHAENEYAQAFEETGIVGLALIVSFAAFVWTEYARATRNSNPPIRLAAIGLGVGLIAVQVHSFSDFGQHFPANACLTAVVCALIISLSRFHRQHRCRHTSDRLAGTAPTSGKNQISHLPPMADAPSFRHRLFTFTMATSVTAVCVWQLWAAANASRAESHWRRAYGMELFLAANGWDAPNETYAKILGESSAACRFAPDNVTYRYALNAYRWHAISRVRDPKTNQLVVVPATLTAARRICQDLREARLLCPTYSHAYLLPGEIELALFNDSTSGADDVHKACDLARCDAAAWNWAARCDARDGKWDESMNKFRRYLELYGDFNDVIDLYVFKTHRPELALMLAQGNIGELSQLGDAAELTFPHISSSARANVFEVMKTQAARSDAPADLLAGLAMRYEAQQENSAAVALYRRAIVQKYGEVNLHLALAKLLSNAGQISDATREARICLRLDSNNQSARRLLGNLLLSPTANHAAGQANP